MQIRKRLKAKVLDPSDLQQIINKLLEQKGIATFLKEPVLIDEL